jgi:hypothetical protein
MEYFVEYIDELGNRDSEIWTQRALDEELTRGKIKITYITLAYHLQVQLGLVSD